MPPLIDDIDLYEEEIFQADYVSANNNGNLPGFVIPDEESEKETTPTYLQRVERLRKQAINAGDKYLKVLKRF